MITQFSINLNKGEDVAEREARWRKRREIIVITLLSLLVIVIAMINVQQYQAIENILKTKSNIIRDIDRQLDSLKKTGKNISKEDVLALAKLEKERVLWTKKLLALGEVMPDEMAITYLEYKNQMLLLRLITTIKKDEKEFDKVKDIIDRLRNSPMFFHDFVEMQLKEQHQTKVEDQTILSFSVVCQIDRSKGGGGRPAGRRESSVTRTSQAISG